MITKLFALTFLFGFMWGCIAYGIAVILCG